MATTEKRWLSMREAAKLLDVSIASIRRWADAGEFSSSWQTPGGHHRFDRAELEAWLKERTDAAV